MGTIGSPMLQWRKFEFFDVEEAVDGGALESLVKDDKSVSSMCSGKSLIYIGDTGGYVHCIGRSFTSPHPSFPAHDAPVSWIWASNSASILVTLAHPLNRCSEIKVWAPDRVQAEQPTLLRLLRPDPTPPPAKGAPHQFTSSAPRVTAVAVHPNLNMLAFGFANGAIMLYRGEIGKDRDRGSTMRVIVTLASPVTNLHFHTYTHTIVAPTPSKSTKRNAASPASVNILNTDLLVTTETNVYSIACTYRDKVTTEELDSIGCKSGCSAVSDGRHEQFFAMATDEAVYTYNSQGKAGCYAFPGSKLYLHCHRVYAVVLSQRKDSTGNSGPPKAVCTLYDLQNNVIALSYTLDCTGDIIGFISEWGGLYCVYNAGGGAAPTAVHFKERDLRTKMEILFKKNQYDIAVSLAKGQNVGAEGVAEILKQYGDWLYSKGDLSMAVHQYIKTIPHLEPSYVIKKFLNSEHMSLLAEYLEALHSRNLHTADHSSLLLNCYTRHKHDQRIQAFIQKHSEQVTQSKQQLQGVSPNSKAGMKGSLGGSSSFTSSDVKVLVGVCREGGFYQEALQLSKLHGLHSLHLEVLCNDAKQFKEAVKYISSLPFSAACEQILTHGAVLARGCPDETLALLIRLATDYTPDNRLLLGEASLDCYVSAPEGDRAAPEMFEGVLCDDSLLTIRYIEGVSEKLPDILHNSPRLCEMLLAEYLHQFNTVADELVLEVWDRKVQNMLSDAQFPINASMACLLCDRHKYPQGKLILWRARGMYENILQYHINAGQEHELVRVCEESGSPTLWLTALRLITSPQLDRVPQSSALQTILDRVDDEHLLPPMEVIDRLSACPHITLGQVRSYLVKLADREEQAAQTDRDAVKDLCAEADKIREQIEDLQTNGMQFTDSKCDACHKELEFPTVHFFCKHSFHQQCFVAYCSSKEEECPVCLPKHAQIKDALKNQALDRAKVLSFGEGPTAGLLSGFKSAQVGGGTQEDEVDVFQELAEYLASGLFTDYSTVLAAQTAHQHTPASKAAKYHKSSAARAALEASQSANTQSESRLRMNEARTQQSLVSASEGRLRQQARTADHPSPSAAVEGRVRAAEVTARHQSPSYTSEGRLRQSHQPNNELIQSATEGRVRGEVSSAITVAPSEARLRSSQGRKFGGQGLSGSSLSSQSPQSERSALNTSSGVSPRVSTSLHDHITASSSRGSLRSKSPEHVESISSSVSNVRVGFASSRLDASAVGNPFESESSNPFGDDFETEEMDNNPFAQAEDNTPFNDDKKDELNPFADDDDDEYDKKLNPFSE